MSTFQDKLRANVDKSLTNAKATCGLSNVSTEMTIDKRGGNSDDVDKTAWDVNIILTDNKKRSSKYEVMELETKIVTLVLKHVPIISDNDNEIGKIDLLYTTKEIVQTDTALFDATKESVEKEREIASNAAASSVSNDEGKEEMPAEAPAASSTEATTSVSNDEGGGGKMPAKTTAVFEGKAMPAKIYKPSSKENVNINSPIVKERSMASGMMTAQMPRKKKAPSIVTIDGKRFSRAINGVGLKPLARGINTPVRKKTKLAKKLPIHHD